MKAAMRHLKRSKGRSLLTLLAVLIPVYMLVFMFGFASANLRDMFETATGLESGHFQVREVQERATGGTLPLIDDVGPILDTLDSEDAIAWRTVRLDVPALASAGDHSQAILVQGVEPETVARITPIETLIVEGEYLTAGTNGAVLGEELAERLHLTIGSEIILLGAHPEAAMGVLKVPVVGIYDAPDASMGRSLIQIDLQSARALVRRPTAATAVVAMVEGVTGPWDVDKIDAAAARVSAGLPPGFEVVSWRQLAPTIDSYMRIMRPALLLIAAIFFALGALVVVNTLYLSVMERTRELGLIIALGCYGGGVLRKMLLAAMTPAALGAALGLAGAVGIGSLLRRELFGVGPHDPVSLALAILVVLATACLAALGPALRAARSDPMQILRS